MPPYRGDGLGLRAFCPCCPSLCNFLRRLHCHSSHCQGGVQVRPFGATCDPLAHRFWQALRLGLIRMFISAGRWTGTAFLPCPAQVGPWK